MQQKEINQTDRSTNKRCEVEHNITRIQQLDDISIGTEKAS